MKHFEAPINAGWHTSSPGLESLVRQSMPDGLVFSGGLIVSAQEPLYPREEYAMRYAASSRRAAFRAGRTYAREALKSVGISHREIPMANDGLPMWPLGVVGSITHDTTHCAAAIAERGRFANIGLDIESAAPLDSDLVDLVCSPHEIKQRPAVDGQLPVDLPKLLFSAKESVYKAYFPLAREFLEFHDVNVDICVRSRTFLATFSSLRHVISGVGRSIEGGFVVCDQRLVTYAVIPPHAV